MISWAGNVILKTQMVYIIKIVTTEVEDVNKNDSQSEHEDEDGRNTTDDGTSD
jgi:hypothetical protein